MKLVHARLLALGGAAAIFTSGCGVLSGDDSSGDDGSGNGETNALAEEMRSWEGGCEVLDNLSPIVEYMQIEDASGLGSSGFGEGMDKESLTCNGLVVVRTFEDLSGSPYEDSGELWGGITPWESEEEAQASYVERTEGAIEDLQGQDSSLEVTDQIDLGSEWDEGVLIVMERELAHNLLLVARDGQWLFFAEINYDLDKGEEYFNDNVDRMTDGQTIEDFAYPFEDEALQQWLVEEYAPAVNQSINDQIGQE